MEDNSDNKASIFDRGINKEVDEKTVEAIDERLKRRIEARKGKRGNPYMGLMFMGMVGWSFAFPFLLGLTLGIWLDNKFTKNNSLVLLGIVLGLALGFLNVIFWVKKEMKWLPKGKDKRSD